MKPTKRSATLVVACMFAGTCSAAIAGSQSLLDPYTFVKTTAPTPTSSKGAARPRTSVAAPEAEATTTTTQYVKIPGMDMGSDEKLAPKPVKAAKVKAPANPDGHGVIAGVNDKVKSAGSGIVGGTKNAGGSVVKGAKAASDGLASGTKKMSSGLASSAKASGSFFKKGAHAMGSGLKAATSTIPGLGHSKSAAAPEAVVAAKTPPVTDTKSATAAVAATPTPIVPEAPVKTAETQFVPVGPLGEILSDKPSMAAGVNNPAELKTEKGKAKVAQNSLELKHEKVKAADRPSTSTELVQEPGVINKTFNKLHFWGHKTSSSVAASPQMPGLQHL